MKKSFSLAHQWNLELSAFKDGILRLRIAPRERTGQISGLERYGFLSEPEDDPAAEFSEDSTSITLKSGKTFLTIDRKTGCFQLKNTIGEILLEQNGLEFANGKTIAEFFTAEEEDWVGFGDVSREHCFYRGSRVTTWIRNVQAYITVPFFMSTRGYAILLNTTHRVNFDMGATDPEKFSFTDRSGIFDIYLFIAPDFKGLLGLYTELTGRPKLPPVWSFGLWHICNNMVNARDVVEEAYRYRELGIPCDVIGLEPGWMKVSYDFSTEKDWHPERFPHMRFYARNDRTFIDAIKKGMGYHFELWLCTEYDYTFEEERRRRSDQPAEREEAILMDDEEFDEMPASSRRLDHWTKPDEPWFEHLKKFIDYGVDFFKEDASCLVNPHPDRHYGNGMNDDEYHNLAPLLDMRQVWEGFAKYTNRRPFIFTPCGSTGFQAWAATWTGDTGSRMSTLCGMFNTAFSGHGLTTNDMGANVKEAVHFGYLLPLSQINNYACFRMPWLWGPDFVKLHRYYSSLRSRLIPYLYSWMRQATRTGIPLLLPLPLEFQDDGRCRTVMNEYLLGRDLLVSIYEPDVYFPRGRWKDYWTGKVYTGSSEQMIPWPENRGGGLYIREGAIIPFGPVMQYRGEKPVDELELYLFPGPEKTEFEYYEDDGVSFDYLEGKYSTTLIRMEKTDCVTVEIIPDGKGCVRKWKICAALDTAPASLECNGSETVFQWDEVRHELTADLPGPGTVIIR
ncbi:MAG: Alpha-xylosidase [Lentisphaerae bacterium ADurb.Bin242]|nr:MAG: Alpha-xylosidase [Lentisphaerae bacterium ADurb.Bin242]